MLSADELRSQLPYTLDTVKLPNVGVRYDGKVRDCLVVGDRRILVASDRISAFDKILTTIPFKGQVLTELAAYWFRQTEKIVPNHIVAHPHPQVMVGREVEIIPVEVVVRGYLAGSAWRDYAAGEPVSGIVLPKGLKRYQKFDQPLLTPSTKAPQGHHDEPISSDELVARGIVPAALWLDICEKAFALFSYATELLAKRNLILVDTKYEFGIATEADGSKKLVLADEVHTPDSSRMWVLDSYANCMAEGRAPEPLDKEFFRNWLLERGYKGDGVAPTVPDEIRIEIARRYIDAFERVTGTKFNPRPGKADEAINAAIAQVLG